MDIPPEIPDGMRGMEEGADWTTLPTGEKTPHHNTNLFKDRSFIFSDPSLKGADG